MRPKDSALGVMSMRTYRQRFQQHVKLLPCFKNATSEGESVRSKLVQRGAKQNSAEEVWAKRYRGQKSNGVSIIRSRYYMYSIYLIILNYDTIYLWCLFLKVISLNLLLATILCYPLLVQFYLRCFTFIPQTLSSLLFLFNVCIQSRS